MVHRVDSEEVMKRRGLTTTHLIGARRAHKANPQQRQFGDISYTVYVPACHQPAPEYGYIGSDGAHGFALCRKCYREEINNGS